MEGAEPEVRPGERAALVAELLTSLPREGPIRIPIFLGGITKARKKIAPRWRGDCLKRQTRPKKRV